MKHPCLSHSNPPTSVGSVCDAEAVTDRKRRAWQCSAYGPEVPATCFFELTDHVCESHDECLTRMKTERQRVYRRINELSTSGDPAWTDLEATFRSPDDLLNADDDTADPS